MRCTSFWAKAFPITITIYFENMTWQQLVLLLTSLIMMQCWAGIRTYHLLDNERMRYVLRHSRGFGIWSRYGLKNKITLGGQGENSLAF